MSEDMMLRLVNEITELRSRLNRLETRGYTPPSNDGTMADNSDVLVPTQAAVKEFVSAKLRDAVLDSDYDYVSGTTTTTSTTLGDMSGMSVTVTVATNALVVLSFQCIHKHSVATKLNTFRFFNGSAQIGGYSTDQCVSDGVYYPMTMAAIVEVAAGTHTYTVQWKTTASTATAAERFFSAVAYSR